MPTVEVRFPPLPTHVRTARLVAVAVARRAGVPGQVLDEVRLAVGEACSRAVDLHRRYAPQTPVVLGLCDDDGRFSATVRDAGPPPKTPPAAAADLRAGLAQLDHASLGAAVAPEAVRDPIADLFPVDVALAVIAGLVDEFEVDTTAADPAGTSVRMTWATVLPTQRTPA